MQNPNKIIVGLPLRGKTQLKGTKIMNATEILNLLPDIIKKREPSPSDKWILLIICNEIRCVATETEMTEGTPLMPINMHHVDKGFSGREWDRLTNRLIMYQKVLPNFYTATQKITDDIETKTKPEE